MVSKSSTKRNEPAYVQIGLVKASGTSCHRNIVRMTRVYLTAVQMDGESHWSDPDSCRQPNNVMRRSKVKPSPWLGDSNSVSTSSSH